MNVCPPPSPPSLQDYNSIALYQPDGDRQTNLVPFLNVARFWRTQVLGVINDMRRDPNAVDVPLSTIYENFLAEHPTFTEEQQWMANLQVRRDLLFVVGKRGWAAQPRPGVYPAAAAGQRRQPRPGLRPAACGAEPFQTCSALSGLCPAALPLHRCTPTSRRCSTPTSHSSPPSGVPHRVSIALRKSHF